MWFEASLVAFLVMFVTASLLRHRSESEEGKDSDSKVIVTYSKTIPGYEVKQIFGYIECSVVMPNEGEHYPALAEQTVVEKLMDKAREVGANAVLELDIKTEEHAIHTKIKARGLAVRV